MNSKILIFILLLGFVFGYTAYEAVNLDKKFSQSDFSETGSVLKTFPENVNFKNIYSANPFELSEFVKANDIVIVHFWATWCGPCEVEFPELIEFIQNNHENSRFKFLIVAVEDDVKKVKKFLSKYDKNKALIVDNVAVLEDKSNDFNKFGTYKLPETYVFKGLSNLVRKFSGQQVWTDKSMAEFFKNL